MAKTIQAKVLSKFKMSVLLINMPFAQLCWPNLGLSLLQGALRERGIDCELKNLCFPFAERVGYELYDWIAGHFAFVLGGEHLFAKEYFGGTIPSTERFWTEVLLWTEPNLDERDKADYETVAAAVHDFLDDCMETVDFSRYKIVGFTTSYQQTLPSLCLAKRIKEKHPEMLICFGGAACEGEMGAELFRRFPEIDYVFLGEADLTFPTVVGRILDHTTRNHPLPPGVLARREQDGLRLSSEYFTSVSTLSKAHLTGTPRRCDDVGLSGKSLKPTGECGLTIPNLDDLPLPDFSGYFDDLRRSPFGNDIRPLLFFETSRGCWWGERKQCLFCGLNGHSLQFRRKKPGKAVDDLRTLIDRYGVRQVCFADNIFAKDYFDSFLPLLKESGLGLEFEFEMKANQTKDQVRKLLDAGLCAAQLGIETFSTPILKMLSKGATARHNLQVVKWYTEAGIEVKWNFLYGFPGEAPEEYDSLKKLLPSIFHFHPPTAFGRVRIDRFAPYHRDPAKYGIENLRPFRGFRFIYPFDEESLRKLSYYHEFDFGDARRVEDYVEPFLAVLRQWETEFAKGTLRAFDRNDGVLLLTDTRPIASEFQYRLSGADRELYIYCDTARNRNEIAQRFPDVSGIDSKLNQWIDSRIMIPVDDRYFSLALGVS